MAATDDLFGLALGLVEKAGAGAIDYGFLALESKYRQDIMPVKPAVQPSAPAPAPSPAPAPAVLAPPTSGVGGLSTGAWVGIGVAAVAALGLVAYLATR